MFVELLSFFIYFFFCFVVGVCLNFISNLVILKSFDFEKNSMYECGFEPFEEARTAFDVHFYLVGILFLVFDLEVMFLFPWCLTLGNTGKVGYFSMFFFLSVLLLGFFYEWQKGALDWS